MYEPNSLDRFLALCSPRLRSKSDPLFKKAPLVAWLAVTLVLLSFVAISWFAPDRTSEAGLGFALTATVGYLILRILDRKPSITEAGLLAELVRTAYGQAGYVAGPKQSLDDHPVPIRSMKKVLSPAAFEFLDRYASAYMRIQSRVARKLVALSDPATLNGVLSKSVNDAMTLAEPLVHLPQQFTELDAHHQEFLAQIESIADLCEGKQITPTTALSAGNPELRSILADLHAESVARAELDAESLPRETL